MVNNNFIPQDKNNKITILFRNGLTIKVVVVDVNNLKNGRKPVKLQKESPAGCAGEGKQNKGN